jgi:hypothetical protein
MCGFCYGLLLAVCGVPFTDWRFWVLMPAAATWALIVEGSKK